MAINEYVVSPKNGGTGVCYQLGDADSRIRMTNVLDDSELGYMIPASNTEVEDIFNEYKCLNRLGARFYLSYPPYDDPNVTTMQGQLEFDVTEDGEPDNFTLIDDGVNPCGEVTNIYWCTFPSGQSFERDYRRIDKDPEVGKPFVPVDSDGTTLMDKHIAVQYSGTYNEWLEWLHKGTAEGKSIGCVYSYRRIR